MVRDKLDEDNLGQGAVDLKTMCDTIYAELSESSRSEYLKQVDLETTPFYERLDILKGLKDAERQKNMIEQYGGRSTTQNEPQYTADELPKQKTEPRSVLTQVATEEEEYEYEEEVEQVEIVGEGKYRSNLQKDAIEEKRGGNSAVEIADVTRFYLTASDVRKRLHQTYPSDRLVGWFVIVKPPERAVTRGAPPYVIGQIKELTEMLHLKVQLPFRKDPLEMGVKYLVDNMLPNHMMFRNYVEGLRSFDVPIAELGEVQELNTKIFDIAEKEAKDRGRQNIMTEKKGKLFRNTENLIAKSQSLHTNIKSFAKRQSIFKKEINVDDSIFKRTEIQIQKKDSVRSVENINLVNELRKSLTTYNIKTDLTDEDVETFSKVLRDYQNALVNVTEEKDERVFGQFLTELAMSDISALDNAEGLFDHRWVDLSLEDEDKLDESKIVDFDDYLQTQH
ncbi:hypothetical protein PCE1_003836 [Barthelona sp. PCE]